MASIISQRVLSHSTFHSHLLPMQGIDNSGDCSDGGYGLISRVCRCDSKIVLFCNRNALSTMLSSLFIFCAVVRIFYLLAMPKIVHGRTLQVSKLIAIAILAGTRLALLLLWCITSSKHPSNAIPAAALCFTASLFLCPLSHHEHSRNVRPSSLIQLYLCFSLFIDMMYARAAWLMSYNDVASNLFITTTCISIFLVILEATGKIRYLVAKQGNYSPEETSGILALGLYSWLNSLIFLGGQKTLTLEDLYVLNRNLRASSLEPLFTLVWNGARLRKYRFRLVLATFKALKWTFLAPVFPRFMLTVFTFCQPFLIKNVLSYLQEKSLTKLHGSYDIVIAFAVVYVGMAVSSGYYWRWHYQSLTMIRGCLVSAIYRKVLEMKIDVSDDSAAVTLMSTDLERIVDGFTSLHDIWANTVEVGIATWLLTRELGFVSFIPILTASICATGTILLSSKMGQRQAAWMGDIQKRVGITSNLISAIKGVRLTGLTHQLTDIVQELRVVDVRSAKRLRTLMIFSVILAFSPLLLSSVITFWGVGEKLNTSEVFTSLTLLIILTQPLSQLFQSIPYIVAAFSSFDRIEEFLLAEGRLDNRKVFLPHEESPDRTTKGSGFEYTSSDSTRNEAHPESEAIILHDATFGWTDGHPVLQKVNIGIPRSQLTFVVGPVACGKSTLCKAILGELRPLRGCVKISEPAQRVAFCNQTPFLINGTILQNICGFSEFQQAWYDTVVDAVALKQDLARLPRGDQTMVGSKGINLSGGQKQRVSIARALYSRATLAIFDDVFVGLDNTVQQHIVTHVFGPKGLFRRQKATVILCTHSTSHLPFADYIIAFSDNGRVIEEGTFEKLNMNSGYVHSVYVKGPSVDTTIPEGESATTERVEATTSTGLTDEIVDSPQVTTDISVYNYYFKNIGVYHMFIFILLVTLFSVLYEFPVILLKWWSDANTEHPEQANTKYLIIYSAMNLSCLVVIGLICRHSFLTMQTISSIRFHWVTLKTVMEAPMAFFNDVDTGVTINRFSQDMMLIDGELPFSLLNYFLVAFMVSGQAILIVIATPYIAVAFPIVLGLLYSIQRLYLKTSRQLRIIDLEAKSPLYKHFLETLDGLATIRAFGWIRESETLLNNYLDASQRPMYLLWMIQHWLTLVLDLVVALLGALLVWLALRFNTSSGFAGVALINLLSFNELLTKVIETWTGLETSIGAISRIKTFSEKTEREDQPNETNLPPKDWPSTGEIEIKGVYASYKSGSGDYALYDLNLSIRPGEKVGICGRSGSGKTSLTLALFRMLELSSGSMTIDGQDLTLTPRATIRSRLNAVPQEPFFLPGSMRLNLDPHGTSTDLQVQSALQKVGLLEALKVEGTGLDAPFHPETMSQGQRQLFCLARAILRPGPVVVLDEATSGVDAATADVVKSLVREEFKGKTVLAVAHRLDMIADFDRVVVMSEGRVVEVGEPRKLLEDRKSAFRELCERSGRNVDGSGEAGKVMVR